MIPERLGDLPTPSGVSRRAFLRALVAAPALASSTLAVDWERLLWTPTPIILVPAMPQPAWLDALAEGQFSHIVTRLALAVGAEDPSRPFTATWIPVTGHE